MNVKEKKEKVEQPIRESEKFYQEIANSIADVFFTMDKNLRYTYWNRASEKLTGISAKDAIGKYLYDLFLDTPQTRNVEKIYRDVLRTQRPHTFVNEYQLKGKNFFFEISAYPTKYGLSVFVRDITERIRIKEELRRVIEGTRAILWHADVAKLEDASQGCRGFSWNTHYLNLDTINKSIPLQNHASHDLNQRYYSSIIEEDLIAMDHNSSQALKCGADSYEQEFRLRDRNGIIHWMHEKARIKQIEDKRFEVIGFIIDITDRKQMEEKHGLIIKTALDGFWINDLKGRFLEVNESYCRMIGYTRKELLTMSISDIEALEKPEEIAQRIKKIMDLGHDRFETRHKRKDGKIIDVEISINYVPMEGQYFVFVHDITERKLAEEEIRVSEERFRTLTEDAPIGIYYNDFNGTFLYGNKKAEEIIGYKSEQLIGKNFLKLKLLSPKYIIKATKLLALNKTGKATGPDKFILNKKDGTQRLVEINTNVISIGDKRVVLGMVQDITERKRTVETLKKEQALIRVLMDNVPDSIYFKDVESRFIRISKALAEKFNVADPNQPIGKTDFDFFTEEHAKQAFEDEQKIIQTGQPVVGLEEKETWPDKQETWVSTTKMPIRDESGKIIGTFGISRDITDRKLAEEQIQKDLQEKEILIRELYHRTKNNMQVISSMLKLKARYMKNEDVSLTFKEIENKISTMALVHKKLYESKDLSYINLKDYINDLISLIKQSQLISSKNITFIMESENVNVLIDTAIPVGLIINELVTNALKHGFPGNRKGEIKIHLHLTEKNELRIDVSDNGVGLSKELDIDKDTHLGLKMVTDLVEHQLQGKISFKSKQGLQWQIFLKKELYKPRI